MRNKRGITLVSLVVTIIVLIILAGVSINLTLGENGIITMAKKARENMELAKVDEEKQLNELYIQMEQEGVSGGLSYDAIAKLVEFKRQIASAITDMGIDTPENADASTMSSNIRNLTGASSADKVSYNNTNSELTSTNVQGAVDELNDSLERLSNSEWVLVDTFIHSGNGDTKNLAVDLSDYKEVKIIAVIDSVANIFSSSIFTSFLGDKEIYYIIGGYNVYDNYSATASIYLTKTTARTTQYVLSSNGGNNSGTYYFYVR